MSRRVVSWQAACIVLPVVLLIVLAARPGDSQLASRAEEPAGPVEPIDIGSRRELFVDDPLVNRFVAPPPPGPWASLRTRPEKAICQQ